MAGKVNLALDGLPRIMGAANHRASSVDRAVVDLTEAAILRHRVGETFAAVVTGLCTMPRLSLAMLSSSTPNSAQLTSSWRTCFAAESMTMGAPPNTCSVRVGVE